MNRGSLLALPSLAASLVALSCYEDPAEESAEAFVALEVHAEGCGESDSPSGGTTTGDDVGTASDGASASDGANRYFADGSCRAIVSVRYPDGADAGIPIVLTTDFGVLNPNADAAAEKVKVQFDTIARTKGALQPRVATLVAPLTPVTARLEAKVGRFTAIQTVEFERAEASRVSLSPTVRTLRAGVTSTDLQIALARNSGTPSLDTAVELISCCRPGLLLDPPMDADTEPGSDTGEEVPDVECDDVLDHPELVKTSVTAPTVLEVSARLTADAERYLAKEGAEDRETLRIFAVLAPMQRPSCSDLTGDVTTSALLDAANIALVREPEDEDTGTGGETSGDGDLSTDGSPTDATSSGSESTGSGSTSM